MKRLFDLVLCLIITIFIIIPFLFAALSVKLTSKGPIIYWSKRVGKHGKLFLMPKLRTMTTDAPCIASESLDAHLYLTSIGSFLRKTSLDEIPQLWIVFKGQMSIVGPRPALFNQKKLLGMRKKKGIDKVLPGITGLAQINGRDSLTLQEKVHYDELYLSKMNFFLDVKIIFITVVKVLKREFIDH